ncbi:hypothetical protein Tco_1556116 [Tanacetum coccineum]
MILGLFFNVLTLVGITIQEKDSSELGQVSRLKQPDLRAVILQEQLEQHLVKDSITHQTLGETTNPSHSLLVEHYVLENEVVIAKQENNNGEGCCGTSLELIVP